MDDAEILRNIAQCAANSLLDGNQVGTLYRIASLLETAQLVVDSGKVERIYEEALVSAIHDGTETNTHLAALVNVWEAAQRNASKCKHGNWLHECLDCLDGSPALNLAYAVRMKDGRWVGIWNDREIAERVCAAQPKGHGDTVVEVTYKS